jgi:16S rRNA processing protein RimM
MIELPPDSPESSHADAFGAASPQARMVILGRIAGVFGVQGWVKVSSFTDPVDNILDYEHWQMLTAGQWQPIEVEAGRVTNKGVLAKLGGIDTPEDARNYVGRELGVLRSELPPPAPGEYYWSDLEGMTAFGSTGDELGRVDHFRSTPAGAIVVVSGAQEHWIPFVKERILSVDLAAGRIVLDWAQDW